MTQHSPLNGFSKKLLKALYGTQNYKFVIENADKLQLYMDHLL